MDYEENVQKLKDRIGSSEEFLQEDYGEKVTMQQQLPKAQSIKNIGTVQV